MIYITSGVRRKLKEQK